MVARIGNTPVGPGPVGPNHPNPLPLPEPTPDISLPANLGHRPTTKDLVIKRTFDGLTPEAAAGNIKGKLQSPVTAEHQPMLDATVTARVRDMQAALNNVFTPGTPISQFLQAKLPAQIRVLGSMSGSTPVTYQVTQPGQPSKYYGASWGGQLAELSKPPLQVVMNAEVTLSPRGIRMTYPAWQSAGLSDSGSVVEE
ncbi:MAG: hypothetical protein QM723_02625 [Myxococcaceae bacterium]